VRDWLIRRYLPEAVVEEGRQEPAVLELSRLSEQAREDALQRAKLLVLKRAHDRATEGK
jgi:hypothetical protein